MRRLIIEEPISRAASWASQVGWFALAVTMISIAIIRIGLVDVRLGLVALFAGLLLALGAVLLTVVAFVRIWREGRRGLGLAVRTLLLGAVILGWPSWLAARAARAPPLTDITTDLADPPAFARSRAALAERDGHMPPDPPPEARESQARGYATLKSLTLDLAPGAAFDLALKGAAARGWKVIDQVRPAGRSGIGHIDAVDRTLVLRIPDDVTVRVRPLGAGTQIDVRSASRFGYHDLGANAQRIRRFLDEVSSLAQDQ